jgi:ABC-type transporter Mla maintaining outer membrane lipid asymmetry ATPase subunit MlaF
VLRASGVVRRFREGSTTLEVLTGLDLDVRAGERLGIIGASGSGKTTLLQILGGLDRPDAGRVEIDGRDLHALAETERGLLRNRTIGFVYQFHHLLAEFSALENVAMPLLVRRMRAADAAQQAMALLSASGSRRAPGIVRTSFPAASGSALRWRARWSRRRASCWPMSRPATSTGAMPSRCSRCCSSSIANSAPASSS